MFSGPGFPFRDREEARRSPPGPVRHGPGAGHPLPDAIGGKPRASRCLPSWSTTTARAVRGTAPRSAPSATASSAALPHSPGRPACPLGL